MKHVPPTCSRSMGVILVAVVVLAAQAATGSPQDDLGNAAPVEGRDAGAVVPCDLECPSEYHNDEGEPPLVDGYVDEWNGGCNSPGYPFQNLEEPIGQWHILFCGVSGWYDGAGGVSRDTDWFTVQMPVASPLEVVLDAEYPTYFYHLGPTDCDEVAIIDQMTAGPCEPATMSISGPDPDETLWLWIGPTSWDAPSLPFEYDYVLWLYGTWGIAVEPTSWSTIKVLFE